MTLWWNQKLSYQNSKTYVLDLMLNNLLNYCFVKYTVINLCRMSIIGVQNTKCTFFLQVTNRESRFRCKKCGMLFKNQKGLTTHYALMHVTITEGSHKFCELCNYQTKNYLAYRKHKKVGCSLITV